MIAPVNHTVTRPVAALTQPAASPATVRMAADRWVSTESPAPPPPDHPPGDAPPGNPWREVPEAAASSALHGIGAGLVGAGIGFLLGGPVGAAIGAGVGSSLAQAFTQFVLGFADGGNVRHHAAAALPAVGSLVGGIWGGTALGAAGATLGILAAPALVLAGYGLYWLSRKR